MSPLLFAFQAARKSGVLLRGAVAALSALPRVSGVRAGRLDAAVAATKLRCGASPSKASSSAVAATPGFTGTAGVILLIGPDPIPDAVVITQQMRQG